MTQEQFLDWAQALQERFEFDGVRPVAMTGGTVNHSQIAQNIYFALRSRLQGTGYRALGPDAGVATADGAVRYPDALVTCTRGAGADRLVPGVLAVFEVLSQTSGQTDRIDKLREYRAVPSIRRYVIVEYTGVAVALFHRSGGGDDWTATALTAGETLPLTELGIEIPVAEFYEDVDLPDPAGRPSGG